MPELPNKFANCPVCDTKLDGATCVDGDDEIIPQAGDVSVCMYCGTILEYEDGLFVHEISDKKLEQIKIEDYSTYSLLLRIQQEILKTR